MDEKDLNMATTPRSRSNVVAFPRVEIRSDVVPSDVFPVGTREVRALDGNDLLGRNADLEPLGDGLRTDAELTRERGLRLEGLDDSMQRICDGHNVVVHRQFTSVNRQAIDSQPLVDDDAARMKPVPQPENYATFAAWVSALCQRAGSQARVAKEVGVSPQAMTKYLKGGSISPKTLERFADHGGVSYAKLRMLVDGRPASEAGAIRDRINQTATPAGAQIGRQWEQIQDERTRELIAEQIRNALELQAKLDAATRKRSA